MGSVNGTIKEVVDVLRAEGAAVGSVSICSFRPFPLAELKAALGRRKKRVIVVVEKSLAPGLGGVVASNVSAWRMQETPCPVHTVIAGLGGRRHYHRLTSPRCS